MFSCIIAGTTDLDIVEEAIVQFRANIMFKNFQPKCGADRTLVYLFCFIQKCLELVAKTPNDEAKAKDAVMALANENLGSIQDPRFCIRDLV